MNTLKKFIENTIRCIILCFFQIITSIISATIIGMLCFIIQKIGFVGNINGRTTFFWLFFVPMHFLMFYLLDKYCLQPIISDFSWYNSYTKKEKQQVDKYTMKTSKTNDRDLNSYNKEDMWWSRDSIKHSEEIKQLCYDSSNPCPYCDTKFKHTALHCAVYFNDMERLNEVIDLIKKADEVDNYDFGVSDFDDTIFGKIFDTKDFMSQTSLAIALEIGSLEIIKLLLQIITMGRSGRLEMYSGNNEWIFINPENEETIKELIDSFNYKKKTQTGKDVLDKDQEQQNLIKNEHEKRIKR